MIFDKVAIVIGHTENAKGSHSELLGDEWTYWNKFIKENIGDLCHVFTHDKTIHSYTKRQEAMAKKTKDFDLVFEIHFNKYDESARGAHAMYYEKSKKGKVIADLFTEYMLNTYGIEKDCNRAVASRNIRGGAFIMLQKGTAVLLEPFFADNEEDVQAWLSHYPHVFIRLIRNLIYAYYDKE